MADHSDIFKYEYPVTSTHFDVFIGGLNMDDFGNTTKMSFQSCSGFKMKGRSVGGRYGDDSVMGGFVVPVGIEYTPMTMRKGVVTGDSLFNFFTKAQNQYENPEGILESDKTIILRTYDDHHNPRVDWYFYNCGNVSYEVEPFDAMDGKVIMESFTFKFWGFKRESHTLLY